MVQSIDATGTGTGTGNRWNAVAVVYTLIRVLLVLEVVVFALAAMAHAGVPLPIGISEPVIAPAAIVEGLISLFIAVSAIAVFTNRSWAWPAAVFSHVFAVSGVLLGITVLALNGGPNTGANYVYHRVMLGVAASVLVLLLIPAVRAAHRARRNLD